MVKNDTNTDELRESDAPERRKATLLSREFYDSTPALLHTTDTECRIVNVSNHWLSRLGYMRNQVIGHAFSEFLTPNSREYCDCIAFPRFFKRGHSRDEEFQMVSHYGEIIDVLLSASALYNSDGAIEQVLVVLTDVTDRKKMAAALTSSEVAYRELFYNMQAGFALLEVVYDEGGKPYDLRFVAANHAYCATRGLAFMEPLEGRLIGDVYRSIGHDPVWLPSNIDVALTGQGFRVVRYLPSSNQWHDVVAYQPSPGRCAIIVQDITEQHRMQFALAEQHERLQITFKSIADGVITTDSRGVIDYLNPVAERLTGWVVADAVGQPIQDVFVTMDELTQSTAQNPVEMCLAERRVVAVSQSVTLIGRDKSRHSVEDSAAPIIGHDGGLLGVVLVFHDVTKQRRMADEMSHRATHDALTGIYNRSEFEQRLERSLQSAQENGAVHALLYIDLDRFKLVNDACGHAAGDQLLQHVVGILQSSIRGRDTLARLGGDEFGVILEFCGPEQALKIAQLMCERLDAYRFVRGDQRFHTGASIGLVTLDDRWKSPAAPLMQAAELACDVAKDAGRNRVHVSDSGDDISTARHSDVQWAGLIERALEENRFCLYWQKIGAMSNAGLFSVGEGGVHGEVLLRLRGDNGEILSPQLFLPVAERFYLATRIDQWVVKTVLAWMATHSAIMDHITTISVNLSGQSIGDLAFHRYALNLLDTTPFDREKLCFEVTETSAISNLTDARAFLDGVQRRGVRVALDDFGSGMSSFGYLKTFPVDYLKIDGQFIRNLSSDEIDQATVRCICEVAKVMGKKTIAEFVETEPVETLLRDIGVTFTQGYLRHRPEPLDLILKAP